MARVPSAGFVAPTRRDLAAELLGEDPFAPTTATAHAEGWARSGPIRGPLVEGGFPPRTPSADDLERAVNALLVDDRGILTGQTRRSPPPIADSAAGTSVGLTTPDTETSSPFSEEDTVPVAADGPRQADAMPSLPSFPWPHAPPAASRVPTPPALPQQRSTSSTQSMRPSQPSWLKTSQPVPIQRPPSGARGVVEASASAFRPRTKTTRSDLLAIEPTVLYPLRFKLLVVGLALAGMVTGAALTRLLVVDRRPAKRARVVAAAPVHAMGDVATETVAGPPLWVDVSAGDDQDGMPPTGSLSTGTAHADEDAMARAFFADEDTVAIAPAPIFAGVAPTTGATFRITTVLDGTHAGVQGLADTLREDALRAFSSAGPYAHVEEDALYRVALWAQEVVIEEDGPSQVAAAKCRVHVTRSHGGAPTGARAETVRLRSSLDMPHARLTRDALGACTQLLAAGFVGYVSAWPPPSLDDAADEKKRAAKKKRRTRRDR